MGRGTLTAGYPITQVRFPGYKAPEPSKRPVAEDDSSKRALEIAVDETRIVYNLPDGVLRNSEILKETSDVSGLPGVSGLCIV